MTTRSGARRIRVRGIVQGVGFRPFVFRLARARGLHGWVSNGDDGVDIHVEGDRAAVDAFVGDLAAAPPAAVIAAIEVAPEAPEGCGGFEIRASPPSRLPTTRISPDLPLCAACERELFSGDDRRAGYPYVNCTGCGPRFSIVRSLPYDRARTTMAEWPMCDACARQYHDPGDRRFHAQPVACPACGPHYYLHVPGAAPARRLVDDLAVEEVARRLANGAIVAIKGIGGYHLACDASNASAVAALRERKGRLDKPFAIMVRDLDTARRRVHLSLALEALLTSPARPIVLARRRSELPGVAPDSTELGVMLPYAPVHALLFGRGAPETLVLTSGNRSDEPIACTEDDAFERLAGIADAWLVGERPIARRMDDSVARVGPLGPVILRRARGHAPDAVARLPVSRPILAVGGDLKSAVTLVVDGQACTSQHIGDLADARARQAFVAAVNDMLAMYGVAIADALVAHDAHPAYASTAHALSLPVSRVVVQHHRAHIASVLAERGALDRRVIGIALDGTGYGDDGTIWGGELFVGSVSGGFERVGALRTAVLAGGDAAARCPAQAAAGFLCQLPELPDLTAPPFSLPARYEQARRLVAAGLRVHATSSAGRLFDTVAALLGFTRVITFEGQAAMWLEQLALDGGGCGAYDMPFTGGELDWRPALVAIVRDRVDGVSPGGIARAFHRGLARGLAQAIDALRHRHALDTAVLSGGVFQNQLLVQDLMSELDSTSCRLWVNSRVPCNDGGLSLGQAAVAACQPVGA
jgi:hydrogenase maturation protein HypF